MEKKINKEKTNGKILNFKKEKMPQDYLLLSITIILTLFGLVMVLSASAPSALINYNNSYYFFKREAFTAVVGVIFMIIISRKLDVKVFQKYYRIIYVISIVILALVMIPGIGTGAKGATRWAKIGPIRFQPSELTKIGLVFSFAGYYCDKRINFSEAGYYLGIPMVLIGIPVAILVGFQNHLSAGLIITIVMLIITIVSRIKMFDQLKLYGVMGLIGYAILMVLKNKSTKSFRNDRITAWLNTWEGDNPTRISYQTVQSLYALASGGILGVGLGKSKQKYLYIPEAHNDFIFAIIVEELGLVGAIAVIALFVIFAVRGYAIAANVKDKFSKLVATGLTSIVVVQAFLNIGVVTNTMPNTGISLPFLSYGSTSLVILLSSVGVLLAISRDARKEEKEQKQVQEGANQ